MLRVHRRGFPLAVVLCCCLLGFSFSVPCVCAECWYNDNTHDEGTQVATSEPCLNCTCSRGALLCYLRICPQLPNPPPPGCILLHRYQTCCPELICTEGFEGNNRLEARSEPDELDLLQTPLPTQNACLVNGSIYGPGSAMDSSSLCEYCYCLRGKQTCVKPKCLLPIEGCIPKYDHTNCCPVHYNCTYPSTSTTSTTTMSTKELEMRDGGCIVDGVYYKEGGKVLGIGHSACDNCYCLRGILRCEPLSCAPPLFGCSPIIKSGECCAASYNCSGDIEIQPEPNFGEFLIVSKEYAKLRKEVQHLVPESKSDLHFVYGVEPESTVTTTKMQRSPVSFGTTRHLPVDNLSTVVPVYRTTDRFNRRVESSETTTSVTDTTTDGIDTTTTEEVSTESESGTETTIPTTTTTFTEEATEDDTTTTVIYPLTLTTVLNSTDCINPEHRHELVFSKDEIIGEETTIKATSPKPRITSKLPLAIEAILNITKNKDSDYEYDYSEPSLPPSLPNLRIIPFVAADALDAQNQHNIIHLSQNRVVDTSSLGYTNLFSPPVETEGGFIPKEPPILENYYDAILTTTPTGNPFQDYNDTPAIIQDRLDLPDLAHTTDPFRDVIRTGPAPNLQSLIVDMMPFLSRKSTTLPPTKKPAEAPSNNTANNKDYLLDKVIDLLFSNHNEATGNSTEPNSRVKSKPAENNESKVDNRLDSGSNGVNVLKLAGCNIYGRMYRVGRIISELSNPCLECKCTETGVQCKALQC